MSLEACQLWLPTSLNGDHIIVPEKTTALLVSSFSLAMQCPQLQETLQLVRSSCSWLQVLGSSESSVHDLWYLLFIVSFC